MKHKMPEYNWRPITPEDSVNPFIDEALMTTAQESEGACEHEYEREEIYYPFGTIVSYKDVYDKCKKCGKVEP